ncbi:MAG TPA: hypothetical protein VIY48_01990 [Candidatus Paceibacterota bacterium]
MSESEGIWVVCIDRDGKECSVWCPEKCLGPSDMKPGYHLAPTKGFTSFTVLDESGKALGWVPKEAKDYKHEP